MLDFLESLSRANIKYVSWKNNHELNMSLVGHSDLDILVAGASAVEFEAFAALHGWLQMETPVAQFDLVAHYFKVNADASVTHLHVYFEVITGESWLKEYNLPLKEFLIERRERHEETGIYRLNKISQAYIFCIRHLLKAGSISSRILYRRDFESYHYEWMLCDVDVTELSGYGPIPIDDWIHQSGLIHSFQTPTYSTAISFRKSLRPYLRYKKESLVLRRLVSFSKRALNKIFSKSKRKFIGNGVIVALSGVDGAGKSTMVSGLSDVFGAFMDCSTLTLGKPQGKALERIRSAIKSNKGRSRSGSGNAAHHTSVMDAISAVVLAILRLHGSMVAVKAARKGGVVVADRWPTSVKGRMDGPKILPPKSGKGLVNILSTFETWVYLQIPKADICFYLTVDIDDALKRNRSRIKEGKESDQEIISRYRNNPDALANCIRLVEFRNDGTYDEMFPMLAHNLWNEIIAHKRSA